MPVIRDRFGHSSLAATVAICGTSRPGTGIGADLGLARRPGIARRSAPGAAGDVPDRHRFFGDLIRDPVPADP
jgi:hypothetical protein